MSCLPNWSCLISELCSESELLPFVCRYVCYRSPQNLYGFWSTMRMSPTALTYLLPCRCPITCEIVQLTWTFYNLKLILNVLDITTIVKYRDKWLCSKCNMWLSFLENFINGFIIFYQHLCVICSKLMLFKSGFVQL